ncbi:hypothetical protein RKE29_10950 [Streptomyces sp. B1866]|uniref:hypothetical protein n=1 Tax=Streptomyces sp. B1866 TaxID=3075431 RepID=UPI0028926A23|nr:hypothetical protein [Streptomyces sp. B1866]MDT3397156.1 hypothetical protein [Streptomyces sp. B1866]
MKRKSSTGLRLNELIMTQGGHEQKVAPMRVKFAGPQRVEERYHQGANTLSLDREYVVLEVYSRDDRNTRFRIEYSHLEHSALFDSRLFSVTSTKIPPSWEFFMLESGSFSLRPAFWNRPGFWEAFYDHEPWALEAYEQEKAKILAAS